MNEPLLDQTWVCLRAGDKLRGEASRLSVAEACLQALQLESTNGHIYEINSAEVSRGCP